MCGRFALARYPEEVTRLFDLAECADFSPRYNIAPATDIPVIRRSPNNQNVLHLLHWGLVPHWSKDPTSGSRLINARSESLTEKPSFRSAFARRRCLIPADGFYEWDRQGTTKQPYYFTERNGELLAFGGLWESWTAPDGSLLRTTCIITTDSIGEVALIHDRMPLVIPRDKVAVWLTGTPEEAQQFLRPPPYYSMRSWPVSRNVNRVQEESPQLIEPILSAVSTPEVPHEHSPF